MELRTVAMDMMRTPSCAPPPGGPQSRRQPTSSTISSTRTGSYLEVSVIKSAHIVTMPTPGPIILKDSLGDKQEMG